jgi:hypothetical protein
MKWELLLLLLCEDCDEEGCEEEDEGRCERQAREGYGGFGARWVVMVGERRKRVDDGFRPGF